MAFVITIPAGTPKATPQVTAMTFPPRNVDKILVQVPPGARGEVGFAVGSSGVAFIPFNTGAYIVTDDEIVDWPLEDQITSGSWQLTAYNTGQYAHTLTVRFLLSLTTTAISATAEPIS